MEQTERRHVEKLLWEWGSALKDCERRRMEIRRLMEQAEDAENVLHAQVLTGMPAGGEVSDPTANAVHMREHPLRRVDQLTAEINGIMARKDKMDAIIGLLPEEQQRLVHMRYVRGMEVSVRIPMQLHADRKTVYRWHQQALEIVANYAP